MQSPTTGITVLGVALRFHAHRQRAGKLLTPETGTVLLVDPSGLIADAGGSPPWWPGITLEDLQGRSLISMIVDRFQLGVAAALLQAMSGTASEAHCLGQHHDGTVRSLTLAISPVVDPLEEHPIGAMISIRESTSSISGLLANLLT